MTLLGPSDELFLFAALACLTQRDCDGLLLRIAFFAELADVF